MGLYNLTAGYIDGYSGAPFFKEISHAKTYKIDKPGSNFVHDKIDINIQEDSVHSSFHTTLGTSIPLY